MRDGRVFHARESADGISFNGNPDTCTIRTALSFSPRPSPSLRPPAPAPAGEGYVQAGGGWVNDSEPEAEFQETVNKSKTMLKAVALAETFAKSL